MSPVVDRYVCFVRVLCVAFRPCVLMLCRVVVGVCCSLFVVVVGCLLLGVVECVCFVCVCPLRL